jgi:hypothetical protein
VARESRRNFFKNEEFNLPSSTDLIIGLLFGSIGMGYFMYGKNTSKVVFRYTGVALMVYPYFIENTIAVLAVGVALMFLPKLIDR